MKSQILKYKPVANPLRPKLRFLKTTTPLPRLTSPPAPTTTKNTAPSKSTNKTTSAARTSSNAYDFANRLTKTRRDHTATPPGGTLKTYTIREEYVYDHASRLRFTRHKINTNNWVVTTAPVYDELNRLADKRLHASNYDGTSAVTLSSNFNYLQSLDYTYNIRG